MTYTNTNKRDDNEAAIVEYWRRAGCIWIPMRPGQGFDGLLIDRSGLYIVEIKNPRTGVHLTPCEAKLRDQVEAMGGEYHVIASVRDAARLIGIDLGDLDYNTPGR